MTASDKTEKPTPKRIADAREKGQVAKSQDFNAAIVLITATAAMAFIGPYTLSSLYGMMHYTFTHLPSKPMNVDSFSMLFANSVQSLIWLLMPFLLVVMVMGSLSNLLQVKPMVAVKALQPKLDKINPVNGFKRMWSLRSIVEVVKALIKMGVIGVSGYLIIQKHMAGLMSLGMMAVPMAWQYVLGVLSEIAMWSCVLYFVMGLLDWRYQAYELEKQLRMSRQEVKDERKNQEGDPMMKSRVRQMGIQISRNRQLASVPTADVVITNPTHFAIALKYDPDVAPAPVVVAKGKDHFALKIKEVAKASGVPMVENKPLARALYPVVEADAMIPPDLFVAVAEVLAYVFSRNKGRRLPGARKQGKAPVS